MVSQRGGGSGGASSGRGAQQSSSPARGGTARGGAPGAGRASNFAYRKREQSAVNERMQRYQQGNRDTFVKPGTEMFKAKAGDNWIRLMPPTWNDANHYAYELWVHYEIGPDNSTYLCPRKMKGEECGICNELAEARNSGDAEYADKLEPGLRLCAWIIDRDDERKGVQLWLYSARMDQEILEQSYDRRTGETIMIDHPQEGYDLEFRRTGERLQTRYTGMKLSRQASDVAASHLDFVAQNPLPDVLKFYSNEHVMTAFSGKPAPGAQPPAEEEKEPQPEEEEKPQQQTARGAARTQEPTKEQPAATGGTAGRRARAQAPQKIDFTAMTLQQQLDYCEQHNIEIPDSVPDEGVGKWMNENAPPF